MPSLTKRILELLDKPQIADQPRHGSPGPRPPLFARHDQAASRSAGRPQVTFEDGPGRDRRVVPGQRMVVAADQTRGRGVQEVLPGPVPARGPESVHPRHQPIVTVPLVTGAAGFAGSHLIEHLLETEPSVAAWSNPAGRDRRVRPTAACSGARWTCSTAGASATRSPSCARPRSITVPASRTSANRGRRPSAALRVNVLGTHHLLEACSTQAWTARSS